MLRALQIAGFVIVERSELELGAGFAVLTGETGAGKSILVDAIELLVGGRGDAAVVRAGAERADLSAEFDSADPLNEFLRDAGLEGDAGVVLLRRTIDAGGRSRCFINGHPATLAQLKQAGELLVDIHGQHEHQSLLRPAAQRALLDSYAGAIELARDTAAAWRTWQSLEQVAAEAQAKFAQREAERVELAEQVAELKRLAPREGEWQQLSAEHTRRAHASSLLAGAQAAGEALQEEEGSVIQRLSGIAARLRALSQNDPQLGPVVEMLESAHAQAAEAARALRNYASRVDVDPEALRAAEARIEALHAAGRKYRVKPAELPELLERLKERLKALELAADPAALQREVAEAAKRYQEAARKLSAKRKSGADRLSKAVTAGMQELAMKGARFAVELQALDAPGATGAEEVEFQVASHQGLPPRPLAKVASGGELSRISLALQLASAEHSPVGTLVFDEVDSGIGGAVAETVGKYLKKLGRQRQVLCVTHLPQVAAQADDQWSVSKSTTRGKPGTTVTRLDHAARVEELARMLGGAEITATTRRHAAELLGKQA